MALSQNGIDVASIPANACTKLVEKCDGDSYPPWPLLINAQVWRPWTNPSKASILPLTGTLGPKPLCPGTHKHLLLFDLSFLFLTCLCWYGLFIFYLLFSCILVFLSVFESFPFALSFDLLLVCAPTRPCRRSRRRC